MRTPIENFQMPRYHEIPTVGLYLEQVIKYINGVLEPLGCVEVTSSMVSNYVKKGYIPKPVKKQYSEYQIACLFFIVISKQVLSMEHIQILLDLQKKDYTPQRAYDYYCRELENMLYYLFGLKGAPEELDASYPQSKTMCRSLVISVSLIIFMNHNFEEIRLRNESVNFKVPDELAADMAALPSGELPPAVILGEAVPEDPEDVPEDEGETIAADTPALGI